jgi:hypothetical protein
MSQLQISIIASAYAAAQIGRKQLDLGNDTEARRGLTAHMKMTVDDYLQRVALLVEHAKGVRPPVF